MNNFDFTKIYSFSKLDLYEKCKRHYYFSYLDPEISPRKKEFLKPRDYKTKGHAVHDAITLFYHLPKNKRNFSSLKECLNQSWISEIDNSIKPPLGKEGGFIDLEHERKAYKDSLVLLKNFLEMSENNPSFYLIPTKDIKNSFSDYAKLIKPICDDFSISGKFDRIDKLEGENIRIIDFKTSSNNQSYSQLEFYKLLAELNFNKKVKTVSFYYLNNKKIKDYDVSQIKKEDIQNKIIEKIEKIMKTENFSPTYNKLCDHCDFQEICQKPA